MAKVTVCITEKEDYLSGDTSHLAVSREKMPPPPSHVADLFGRLSDMHVEEDITKQVTFPSLKKAISSSDWRSQSKPQKGRRKLIACPDEFSPIDSYPSALYVSSNLLIAGGEDDSSIGMNKGCPCL